MRLAMIGYGTVGQGVADLLHRHAALYAQRAGEPLTLTAILVRNADRPREIAPPPTALLTDEPKAFFATEFDMLIEVAGGTDFARDAITRALDAGRDVVTANKALIAAHGPELFEHAEAARRRLAFEAAVAGGLPIIDALTTGLAANRVHAITGILNATCNFILARMIDDDCGYPAALAAAQRLGYAEADPALDISGRDAAEKLAILAALAFGHPVDPETIPTRGLDDIELEDLHLARSMGYTIKLIAEARRAPDASDDPGAATLRVAPMLVPLDHPLASVTGAQLAAIIEADAVPRTLMIADAAGRHPTASAVVADVIALTRLRHSREGRLNPWPTGAPPLTLASPGDIEERTYIRLHVLHHECAYDTLRDHLHGAGIAIDRLQETADMIALVTRRDRTAAVALALADPISAAFHDTARVTLPVLPAP